MKIFKSFTKFDWIWFIGLVLWFLETAYFGFNETPVNGVEKMLDSVATITMAYGFLGMFTSTLKTQVNVKADRFEILDK